ncbi:hypothetical protein ABZU92_18295 [Micromonospora arida]|uniref:hypothetical protein n=1 Tax=Micromonospora arida TaxID=2203715 RepID=UPI0033BC77F7
MGFKTFNDGDVLTASDLNVYLMRQAVIECTSGTRPSSPVEGMTIYETDTDTINTYTSAGWEMMAAPVRPTVVDRQGGQFTATVTSFGVATTGGSYAACGVAFVAPSSGRLLLHFSGVTVNSTTADTLISPVVRSGGTVGSGSVILAGDDNISVRSVSAARSGATHLMSGLVGGSTYNVRLEHRVTGGTGTFSSRAVIAQPTT